jgi:hypothetical protein
MEGQSYGYGYPGQQDGGNLQFFPTSYSDDDGTGGAYDFNPSSGGEGAQFMSHPMAAMGSGSMEGSTTGFEDEPPLLEGLLLPEPLILFLF